MSSSTQTINEAAVVAYLSEHLPGFEGPLETTKFDVGQSNPTFLLTTPSKKYVLRRKPPGMLLKSAHAVDREFRVQKGLADSNVPVAEMYVLCEDDDVIGSMFYVMEFKEGRLFGDPRLGDLEKPHRRGVMDAMNKVLADLHMVDIDAVGLSDYGPPGNYFERQIGRWSKQYRAAETTTIPAMDTLMERLVAEVPEDDGQRSLVHGDYRIDNMLFHKDREEVLAVLDWELSTIGHPYADLASVIMQWQMPPGNVGRGLAGVDRAAEGLMTDEEFIAKYCERRGLGEIPHFGYYVAFCFFRMTGIIQGVYKRALDGNASNPERARTMGEYVPTFAEKGLLALDGKLV